MKRGTVFQALALLAILLAACGGTDTPPTPTAVAISAPFGGFKITSPVPLEETTKSVEAGFGTLEVTTFLGSSGDFTYSVVYADYPANYAAVDAASFLSAVRDDQVAGLGGSLVSEGKLEVTGVQGREIQIGVDLADGTKAIHRSRLYWLPTRLYQVSVLAPAERANEAAVTAFLDSFKLTDRAY